MLAAGIALAVLSGLCNGLFSAPMKLPMRWKWENIWLVFIVVACLIMPVAIAYGSAPGWSDWLGHSPQPALNAALGFGFAWGFGAICFGRSVDRLGVSMANSLVIGISSALGSLVPLILGGSIRASARIATLFLGILTFLAGVALCGAAGRLRDRAAGEGTIARIHATGYLFAAASGIMSAVFNIGFTLALPIRDTGIRAGASDFGATNCIWLLMLGAGSIPNIAYCAFLMRKNHSAALMDTSSGRPWLLSTLMGLLWGGSIFLYGAAVPRLGDIGPSIGWPLSLAVGLVVANGMGILLGEWRTAPVEARSRMRSGILVLILAIILCAASTRLAA
jgi:L-rhamnose-H+ transport protein